MIATWTCKALPCSRFSAMMNAVRTIKRVVLSSRFLLFLFLLSPSGSKKYHWTKMKHSWLSLVIFDERIFVAFLPLIVSGSESTKLRAEFLFLFRRREGVLRNSRKITFRTVSYWHLNLLSMVHRKAKICAGPNPQRFLWRA